MLHRKVNQPNTHTHTHTHMGFPGDSVVKILPAKGDLTSIAGLGRSPGSRMPTHFSILAWKIPWTKEPGGLQSMGSQRI